MKRLKDESLIELFMQMDFDRPRPPEKKKATASDIDSVRRLIVEDIQLTRAALDREECKTLTDYSLGTEKTVLEEQADLAAETAFYSEEQKTAFLNRLLTVTKSRFDNTASHYATVESISAMFQKEFRSANGEQLPGFRRVCDEYESWSRSSDLNKYGNALFKYCTFFRLVRRLVKQYAHRVLEKLKKVLDKPDMPDIDLWGIEKVAHKLNAYYTYLYSVGRINTTPSLMVPSAIVYKKLRNQNSRYVLSFNAAAKFLQEPLGNADIKSESMIIEVPDAMWLNETFNLKEWISWSEKAKKTYVNERRKTASQNAEFVDDIYPGHGRQHVYLVEDNGDMAAYYASDQDLIQQIFCLRPLRKETNQRLWSVVNGFLQYKNSSAFHVTRSHSERIEIGKDKKIAAEKVETCRKWSTD